MTQTDIASRDLRGVIEQAVRLHNESAAPSRRDALRNFRFAWRVGNTTALLCVEGGVCREPDFAPGIEASWDFTLQAPEAVWREFLRAVPKPNYHHLFAMWARVPEFTIDGSREVLMRHAAYVNRLMVHARDACSGNASATPMPSARATSATREAIRGAYWRLPVRGVEQRLYVEQAGSGRDLLLLHTAGSDSRQYTHLLNDERITANWRLTAFDLAGHGKSFPAGGVRPHDYRLSEDDYIAQVIAVCDALKLENPVVLGCSMAGSLCLRLAQRHPGRFGGVIACEAAERVPSRLNHWLVHPAVDGAEFAPQWIDGLMAPDTPAQHREEILWCYSQAAADVFHGDVAYYSGSFRMDDAELAGMDTSHCPVFMLTGAYDYSCTPEMSRRTAAKIPGARFIEMTDLGHFPVAENPERFAAYLLPILSELHPSAPVAR